MEFIGNTIDFMVNVINYFQHMPPEVLQVIGASIGVTVITQRLKKWLATKSRTLITFLLGVVSFVPVVIDYVSSQVAANPGVLAPRTIMLMGSSTILYNTLGKWVIGVLEDARTLRQQNQVVAPAPEAATVTAFE